MGLMAYEPHGGKCTQCGRTIEKHPWDAGPNEGCAFFQDPEFTAGVDREEDEEIDTPEAFLSKESTRSEVHGVSTAGYADDVKTPMVGSTEWLQWQSRVNPQLILRRKAEIELVQPAFKRMWSRYGASLT